MKISAGEACGKSAKLVVDTRGKAESDKNERR
jgi:hypothetical protein